MLVLILEKYIPGLNWIKNYKKSDLMGDLLAGLVVAVMLIPQAMAYALIAGLPPVMGLYAATIPIFVYALFGSSRQLAVGPSAIVSMLTFAAVSAIVAVDSQNFVALAIMLALMVGIIQTILGLINAGFISNFLSEAVISGFTSAAAIIIALGQLKNILGINIERQHSVFLLAKEIISNLSLTNAFSMVIGIVSILLLFYSKKLSPRFPGALLVVVGSSLIVYSLNLDKYGVSIVGDIPKGLATFSFPSINFQIVKQLLPAAITISFISFMESIAVARIFATRDKYKISANHELVGLGLANIVGSFFSAFPVTGGFGRSAVNYQAGAKTQLAAIFTATFVILALLFFTPLFYFLPKSALAAIVVVAVLGLIDINEFIKLYKIRKIDALTLAISFFATLLGGVETGIIVGVIFSLLVFIRRSAYPHIAELGYLKSSDIFRNVKRYPESKTFEGIYIARIDASLYFANMAFLANHIRRVVAEHEDLKQIVLDFSSVNDIDAIALLNLEERLLELRKIGIDLHICAIKGPLRDTMTKSGWFEKYQANIRCVNVKQAIATIKADNELAFIKTGTAGKPL